MGARRHGPRHFTEKGTGTLVALSQGDRSCRSQVQVLQRGLSSSDACGDPSDMYASFSWKVDNPSHFFIFERNSPVFNLCGTQWVISTCRAPDLENTMSLFLSVANHEMILPGWSQYAQFTVIAVNKYPVKSIHYDGFHQFSKSELDWGWSDFLSVREMARGFVIEKNIEFKIHIQLMREKPHPFSSVIQRKYRRDLFREMGWEIEEICFQYFKEQKTRITILANNATELSRLGAFYKALDKGKYQQLSRERTDVICKALVENIMKGEDPGYTAVLIEMLYLGMEALANSYLHNSQSTISISDEASTSSVKVENGMFALADNISKVINSFMELDRPWNYEMILHLKSRKSVDDFCEEYPCEEEVIFAEIGRQTLETFAIAHIFCEKIYPEYQLNLSIKKQEELLKELDAEKERESKKPQKSKKPKEKNRKKKDKAKDAIAKIEIHHQQIDIRADQVGEDITQNTIQVTSKISDQLYRKAMDLKDNGSTTIEDINLSHSSGEPMTSNSNIDNTVNHLDVHMDNLSIDQDDTTWIRKEKKKSRATRTQVKQTRDSNKKRGSSSNANKHYSSKKEPSNNPVDKRAIFKQSPLTEDPKSEKIERSDGATSHITSSEPSRAVDMSQKSWDDFSLGLTFGKSFFYVPSSYTSDDFHHINLINYLLEDEEFPWTHNEGVFRNN